MLVFLPLLAASAVAFAAPIEERTTPFEQISIAPWNAGAVDNFQIHASCNSSQTYQIQRGLNETLELVRHAKDHILRWHNESQIYRKYFGDRPSMEAIGSYELILNGDKAKALFRCDDPDRNCANDATWAGHWRGNNATDETVICDRSFEIRRPLASLCGLGYNVRQSSRVVYWASDLLHRLYHMPAFGQHYVEHYAEGYDNIVSNATANSPNATHDSDALQYFALEAYAYDIINPGVGCPGPSGKLAKASTSSAVSSGSSSTLIAATTAASSSSSTVGSTLATATSTTLPANCHTHADGSVHCT